jgi:ABC-2 type transport system ATP-binding protein
MSWFRSWSRRRITLSRLSKSYGTVHGAISVFGVPPARAVQAGWAGRMLQTGSPLGHLRVRELIALTVSCYPAPLRVDDVLRLIGADEFASRWTSKLSDAAVRAPGAGCSRQGP